MKTWRAELFASAKDTLKDCWCWWIGEFTGLWQDALSRLFKRNGCAPVSLHTADSEQSSNDPFILEGTKLILSGPFLRIKGIEKRLPLSRARAVARAIVAEKTPFDCEDIYIFPFNEPTSGTTYFLARKSSIKPILDELYRQRQPLKSLVILNRGMQCQISGNEVNWLHPVFMQRTWKQRLFQFLCLSAGVSFLCLYIQMDRRLVHAESFLTEIVETQRTELKAVRKSLQERQFLLRTNEAAAGFKRDAVSLIQLWEKLTRVLPDDVWLTDLSFTGEAVSITGQARGSAASLIPMLNASDYFTDPTLAAAIVRVPGQAGERFEISMKVKR